MSHPGEGRDPRTQAYQGKGNALAFPFPSVSMGPGLRRGDS